MGDGLFDIPRYEPERIERLPEKKTRNSFLEKAKERAAKRRLQEPLPEKEPETRKTKAEPVNDIKTEVENLNINQDEEDIKTEIIEESQEPEEPQDFKIFDNIQAQKKKRLAASFPRWCENPEVIDGDFTNLPPLEELHEFLDETIYKNLEAMNFTTVFPVQRAIIPELLKRGPPRDLAVQGMGLKYLVFIEKKSSFSGMHCRSRITLRIIL